MDTLDIPSCITTKHRTFTGIYLMLNIVIVLEILEFIQILFIHLLCLVFSFVCFDDVQISSYCFFMVKNNYFCGNIHRHISFRGLWTLKNIYTTWQLCYITIDVGTEVLHITKDTDIDSKRCFVFIYRYGSWSLLVSILW